MYALFTAPRRSRYDKLFHFHKIPKHNAVIWIWCQSDGWNWSAPIFWYYKSTIIKYLLTWFPQSYTEVPARPFQLGCPAQSSHVAVAWDVIKISGRYRLFWLSLLLLRQKLHGFVKGHENMPAGLPLPVHPSCRPGSPNQTLYYVLLHFAMFCYTQMATGLFQVIECIKRARNSRFEFKYSMGEAIPTTSA